MDRPLERAVRAVEAAVPELCDRFGVPGVAVALVHHDDVALAGFGTTNAEHPLPVDGRTLFQIGSVTKTLQATMTMQDVSAGHLDLDEPARAHLPELALADEHVAEAITVRHLLTHRGGFFGDELLLHGAHLPGGRGLADGVAALRSARQVFALDTVTSYANAAFTVLGLLSCRLSGRDDWAGLLRERVLAPAGMGHSYTRADEIVTHRVAAPHRGGRVLRSGGWQPGWELVEWDVPVGGVVSCAEDLARWITVQLRSGQGEHGPVLDEGSARAMHTRQVAWGGLADSVGLTWWLRDVEGVTVVCHGGQTPGYETDLGIVPERGVGWAVLTNGALGGSALYRELRREVLRELAGLDDHPPRPDPSLDAADLAGRYDLPFSDLEVSAGDEPGTVVLTGRPKVHTRPAWSPPQAPPATAALYLPDRAVVVDPPLMAGQQIDVGRGSDGAVAWLRSGGRAGPRLG
jgi:CubicO group peptidase (beta-lactamase class C family)